MLYVTYIYEDFWGTEYTINSAKKHGYEIEIIRTNSNTDLILKKLLETYKELSKTHETFVYADSADSFFVSKIEAPNDKIIYQTELACFPFVDWADKFTSNSYWRYLNGGGCCGSLKLMVEFMERYKLNDVGDFNPQAAIQRAYLEAKQDGFPIELDVNCEIFQSIAFCNDQTFKIEDDLRIRNTVTNTYPSIFHGNGRTPMDWLYKLL